MTISMVADSGKTMDIDPTGAIGTVVLHQTSALEGTEVIADSLAAMLVPASLHLPGTSSRAWPDHGTDTMVGIGLTAGAGGLVAIISLLVEEIHHLVRPR